MSIPRQRRRKAVKPANWTATGWPDQRYRLPDLDVLEAASRPDGDQVAVQQEMDFESKINRQLGGRLSAGGVPIWDHQREINCTVFPNYSRRRRLPKQPSST